MQYSFARHGCAFLAALFWACAHSPAWSQDSLPTASNAVTSANELNLLLLEVRLDGSLLADSLNAYEVGNDLLLPLGELARLLTLGITVDPASRMAAGFVVREDRPFRLVMGADSVTLPTGVEALEPAQVRWLDNELYVSSRLLQRWWPVELKINLATLSLQVVPRETLPIQARLAREREAALLRLQGAGYQDPGFPRAPSDYGLVDAPFVDQTLGLQVSRDNTGKSTTDMTYNAFITGDLLGMEAAMFVSATPNQVIQSASQNNNQSSNPHVRLTLSRNDPDANLLGPLQVRSLTLGNVGLPALNNVVRSMGGGNGLVFSNRPLNQPSSFGLHSLRGELPPGWDVTLYFNDALIAFQQSRADGRYQFDDQTLVFGRNEFRLVFNGPLGQRRVEREVFLLDDTLTKPGRFYYTAGSQRGSDASQRQTFQSDFGLADNLAATAGLVSIDLGLGAEASFTNALNLQTSEGSSLTSGVLQARRRVAGIGVSSQLAYTLGPGSRFNSVAIAADKNLSDTARINLGLVQNLEPRVTTLAVGYNRNFGSFGLGVSARYSSTGEVAVGMQLFMSIGRDPRSGNWTRNWQPMAAAGAVSARAFVDANMNGLFDVGEMPVENAGFLLNGGNRHPVRTDADGTAYMSHMTPRQYVDVALDTGTLEDPQWQVTKPGVRVLPRPGKVVLLDFPVVITSEIDGTVYFEENGKNRGIGNALLELLNERGEVVASQRSAADGYYIVSAVKPGRYSLRLAPDQLRSLGMVALVPSQPINMLADGNYVNGINFTLRAAP